MTTIKQGSTGAAVRAWQKVLGVKEDGVFGAETKSYTQSWQAMYGLEPDGIVGPLTWGKAISMGVVTSSEANSPANSGAKKPAASVLFDEPPKTMQAGMMPESISRLWDETPLWLKLTGGGALAAWLIDKYKNQA